MKSIGSLVRSSLPARGAYARDNTEPPEGGEREKEVTGNLLRSILTCFHLQTHSIVRESHQRMFSKITEIHAT
jgi:hypothetical protein